MIPLLRPRAEERRIVLVTGAPRSGTTVVGDVLAALDPQPLVGGVVHRAEATQPGVGPPNGRSSAAVGHLLGATDPG